LAGPLLASQNWPVLDDEGSIIAVVHHVTDATASVLAKKALRAELAACPSDALLQSADQAIFEAREVVRETREAILASRAVLEEGLPSSASKVGGGLRRCSTE
jgi:hypothetical protein